MRPFYLNIKKDMDVFLKKSSHITPHIHKAMEFAYVTEGTLEIGCGQELFHMETGDFALVFPEVIHHYQVFSPEGGRAVYLQALPAMACGFQQTLKQYCPKNPVVPGASLHPDVSYAMNSLLREFDQQRQERKKEGFQPDGTVGQAFVQIILARCLPFLELEERSSLGRGDIVYQAVTYLAAHFTEPVSLTSMAKELGFSPYALSRVFSGVFHRNFNQYLNGIRLDYACGLLQDSDLSITEVFGEAGFESQCTFNRVFRERYHMSPREYRKEYQKRER